MYWEILIFWRKQLLNQNTLSLIDFKQSWKTVCKLITVAVLRVRQDFCLWINPESCDFFGVYHISWNSTIHRHLFATDDKFLKWENKKKNLWFWNKKDTFLGFSTQGPEYVYYESSQKNLSNKFKQKNWYKVRCHDVLCANFLLYNVYVKIA